MNTKQIAEWMRELSGWFEEIATYTSMTCTNELNLRRAAMWEDRAAQVEAMDPQRELAVKVLEDWLDCADTPEEWMRCRNNAKIVLGRSAEQSVIDLPEQPQSGQRWRNVFGNDISVVTKEAPIRVEGRVKE